MADYRYDVDHTVSYNELDQIRDILSRLQGDDTCSIIIDGVNNRNADRVVAAIDEQQFAFYTKSIGEENDTQVIVKRK